MGKLIVTEFATLDGVAQAPGRPDEDGDGGFTYGGWQAPLHDPESGRVLFEQARSMDALLLGRRTYEIFANYWPTAPEEMPFTGLLNDVPKYVVSRTLAGPLVWQGSTLGATPILNLFLETCCYRRCRSGRKSAHLAGLPSDRTGDRVAAVPMSRRADSAGI